MPTTLGPRATTRGLVLHRARLYDFVLWLFLHGRERAFRDQVIALSGLRPGERVLDVGCGTGTLALHAAARTGAGGLVHALDASPELLARGQKKARDARADVTFHLGTAEALPFHDASFDVVLNTMMLHHLPEPARARCAGEMRRVIRPGGRVLVVDFVSRQEAHGGWMARAVHHLVSRLHGRHGHVKLHHLVRVVEDAGLHITESGPLVVPGLHHILATAG